MRPFKDPLETRPPPTTPLRAPSRRSTQRNGWNLERGIGLAAPDPEEGRRAIGMRAGDEAEHEEARQESREWVVHG